MALNVFEREQINTEIDWLNRKIDDLQVLAKRQPSRIREIRDLKRQVQERAVSLAFNERVGRK